MFAVKSDDTAKEKKFSPKDAMEQKMEAMSGTSEMVFKLGQIYVKPFITVALNPEKGKKFIVFQEAAGTDGKPSGKRGKFWETSKAKEIAGWVLEREGTQYQS